MSVGQLLEKGFLVTMEDEIMSLLQSNIEKNRTFKVNVKSTDVDCLNVVHSDDESWLWHRRYVHLNFRSLGDLRTKGMVIGVPSVRQPLDICEVCMKGKQARWPFVVEAPSRDTHALGVVHSDVCGPLEVPSLGGNKYFVSFVDELIRMLWLYLVKAKSEVLEVFKKFRFVAEKQSGQ